MPTRVVKSLYGIIYSVHILPVSDCEYLLFLHPYLFSVLPCI